LQHVQLLVELLGSSTDAGFPNLSQPLRSMTGIVCCSISADASSSVATTLIGF